VAALKTSVWNVFWKYGLKDWWDIESAVKAMI
jgi:hypothetical protein